MRRCLVLLLSVLSLSSVADSNMLLLKSSGSGSSSTSSLPSIPTTDAQTSYPANQDIIITITPPAGEVLKPPMTWTLYYVSTNQEVGSGVQTGSTINTIVGEGGSYRLHVDGFYESNNAWSMLLFFEGQDLPPTLVSQTTYEEGGNVDFSFTAPQGKTFKPLSLICDIYDQEAEPRQRLGGTPDNLFTDSWSHVAGTPAVLWYECSGEYTDDSPWSLFFPLETVAASASAPPPLTPEQQQQQQQTEIATAALETASQITSQFIQSMNDPTYMNYLNARVNEWTAIAAFWCDTGNLPLQCNRVDQRRIGWFRTRQFFLEHLQGSSPLSRSDCALTLMVEDGEANKTLEPFFYSFLPDPQNNC